MKKINVANAKKIINDNSESDLIIVSKNDINKLDNRSKTLNLYLVSTHYKNSNIRIIDITYIEHHNKVDNDMIKNVYTIVD